MYPIPKRHRHKSTQLSIGKSLPSFLKPGGSMKTLAPLAALCLSISIYDSPKHELLSPQEKSLAFTCRLSHWDWLYFP